eukprot:9497622-Pyramimonas_sp.AAC.1
MPHILDDNQVPYATPSLSPSAIDACYASMSSNDISLPFCDWCLLRVYSFSPPLLRLARPLSIAVMQTRHRAHAPPVPPDLLPHQ